MANIKYGYVNSLSSVGSGTELFEFIQNAEDSMVPLIEGLFYEEEVLMLFSEPGKGKSILASQMALSLTQGIPLFGYFGIPEKRPVFYMQLEGSPRQYMARLDSMFGHYRCTRESLKNLYWAFWEGIYLMDVSKVNQAVELIKMTGICQGVVIVDSIYNLGIGSMRDEIGAENLRALCSRIKTELACSVILLHHSHRPSYNKLNGQRIEEDDAYYGSVFIKALIDTSYQLNPEEKTGGCKLINKKDRNAHKPPKVIELEYDSATQINRLKNPPRKNCYERCLEFIEEMKRQGREEFSIQDIMEATGHSKSAVHRAKDQMEQAGLLLCQREEGKAMIWRII